MLSFDRDLGRQVAARHPGHAPASRNRRIVWLPGGEELSYDGLIIATGVDAGTSNGAPRHDPRVHVLRTLDDALGIERAIRAQPGPGRGHRRRVHRLRDRLRRCATWAAT